MWQWGCGSSLSRGGSAEGRTYVQMRVSFLCLCKGEVAGSRAQECGLVSETCEYSRRRKNQSLNQFLRRCGTILTTIYLQSIRVSREREGYLPSSLASGHVDLAVVGESNFGVMIFPELVNRDVRVSVNSGTRPSLARARRCMEQRNNGVRIITTSFPVTLFMHETSFA